MWERPSEAERAHRGLCGRLTPGLTHRSAVCITPSPRRQLGSQDPPPRQPPLPGSPQSPGWRATPTLSSRLADLLCAGDQMGVGREPGGGGSRPRFQRGPSPPLSQAPAPAGKQRELGRKRGPRRPAKGLRGREPTGTRRQRMRGVRAEGRMEAAPGTATAAPGG